jgi:hypothetical protein
MIKTPRCFERECKHFTGVIGRWERDQLVACAAFPEGIPDDVAYGDNLHLEPIDGDHGIQYEHRSDLRDNNSVLRVRAEA